MARKQLNAVIRLVWLRIIWWQGNGYTHWPPALTTSTGCVQESKSYFYKAAAAARFVVTDVRGQITTHRAEAAGSSIFAIAQ